MGVDLVVTALSIEWARYTDDALALHASLARLTPFGEPPCARERSLAERAFALAPSELRRADRPGVARAIGALRDALSARFGAPIRWDERSAVHQHLGHLDPEPARRVQDALDRMGVEGYAHLAVLDASNLYLPVELATPLVGQPRSIASSPRLARELADLGTTAGDDDAMREHLHRLARACSLAMEHGAVIVVGAR